MIIGLTGFMGSGKTEVAKILVEQFSYHRERFAGPLKDMLRAIGLTDDELDGNRKEVPCDLLGGTTPRHAMQTLGTEWGRDLINRDIWARLWTARVTQHPYVVTDDMRFPNEGDLIRQMGGTIWRIHRPDRHGTGHVSESHVQHFLADATIENDGSINDLRAKVRQALQ